VDVAVAHVPATRNKRSVTLRDGRGLFEEDGDARAGHDNVDDFIRSGRLAHPEGALAGLRRAGRVVVADSVNATVDAFEDAGFDPATDVVVHAKDAGLASRERDPSAVARVTEDGADRLVVETSGERPGILSVDRSFTPRVTATVDGRPATVYAADLNLIGIPVPAGRSRVVVDLAP